MKAFPVALYGVVLFMAAIAYTFLVRALVKVEGKDSVLAKSIGNDAKGFISLLFYMTGILLSIFIHPWFGYACYIILP